MNISRHFVLLAITVAPTVLVPSFAQDGQGGQATPAVSGSGHPGNIAIWKNSTTLGSAGIYATDGNIGIGTTAPVTELEVNGNTQVDGNVSLSGNILLTGVGPLIQAPNNGSQNFSAGLGALSLTATGYQNTAIGDNALAVNTTGVQNTALGLGALGANTTGTANTAGGWLALAANTTGFGNTATGYCALCSNTFGTGNMAIGSNALTFNSSGSNNTASGAGVLYNNTTGGNNTATGYGALLNNTTGSSNIAIGDQAGLNLTATNNNIEIGNPGTAADSGTIRIGCASNCAFGTGPQTVAFIAGIYGTMTGLPGVPVLIDSNGNLGTMSSSRRYKDDIQDMGGASNGLLRLRPVTFRYKKAYDDGSKPIQYGLIAEEVAEVYPDLVARSADGQIETIKYQLLTPMLLNEIKKQKEQIRSLEERLARVEAALGGSTIASGSR
jgi:hypothetical protein